MSLKLKPWYEVVQPREDLCLGRPLDASEFAVNLEKVKSGEATKDYTDPKQFFERTYLTQSMISFASEAIRRLSGEKTETSAVFNLVTQFGGGKTHALTLLYHIAQAGSKADRWIGIDKLLNKSGVASAPVSNVAVFVGNEFDSITGRGGTDGTPNRKTPWGEIAFQLGGEKAYKVVAEHDKQMIAPGGDVIRQFLPKDTPSLILIDELLNYFSRCRKMKINDQMYNFLQNLSEEARAQDKVVLAVSIPSSEIEMTPEDQTDHERLKHLLNRLGKAIIMSTESETSEIIRRRLFEWNGFPDEANKTIAEYSRWIIDNRHQLPQWFPIDKSLKAFEASYPFHPGVLSLFERKWQALPRFQRTRGILRLLALWVSKSYIDGNKKQHRDPLITLGSAPLDDSSFRTAMFEQLGEIKLEVGVTTDIIGREDSHAVRLDQEAVDTIKKSQLHRKISTTIFFESNGGQTKTEATVPEIRLAVGEPDLEIGNVETVLETLSTSCYYLSVIQNRYRFSLVPNLNKILADRRANINKDRIRENVCREIQNAFKKEQGIEVIFFPEKSINIPNQPLITLVVMSPEYSIQDSNTKIVAEQMTKEYGTSARTFKSALIWCVPDNVIILNENARKLLAWEDIKSEESELRLDESQKIQITEQLKRSQRDLKETIWGSYNTILYLDSNNKLESFNLGRHTSSSSTSIVSLILEQLRHRDEIVDYITPNKLVNQWPPALKEWSIKSVRDAFFASPQFPKLLKPDAIKKIIAKGVNEGLFAYVGKSGESDYNPFVFNKSSFNENEVSISEEMYILKKENAESYKKSKETPLPTIQKSDEKEIEQTYTEKSGKKPTERTVPVEEEEPTTSITIEAAKANKLEWSGEIPKQKWTNFYTKVLSRFAANDELKLTIHVEVVSKDGISQQKVEETKASLRELGLDDDVETQ